MPAAYVAWGHDQRRSTERLYMWRGYLRYAARLARLCLSAYGARRANPWVSLRSPTADIKRPVGAQAVAPRCAAFDFGGALKKLPRNSLKTLGFAHRKIARCIFFEKII